MHDRPPDFMQTGSYSLPYSNRIFLLQHNIESIYEKASASKILALYIIHSPLLLLSGALVNRTEAVRRHVAAVLRPLRDTGTLSKSPSRSILIQIGPRKRPVGRPRKAPPAVMASVDGHGCKFEAGL